MKTISPTFRQHLDQEVTALCTCWSIRRLDGAVLRFTDADEDVVQGGQTYTSIGAYQRTAIESTSTLSVDNLEIVGASNDLALPEDELRAGLFDNAQVTIFMTPWLNSVRGRLKLRRGFFGEVQTLPNGTYQVELRGIMQRLAYNYTDIFSATCLYDLGEKKCGIIIKGDDLNAGTQYAVGDGARIALNTYRRGKVYDINWGDPDFESAGSLGGFGESIFWYNEGLNDISTNGASAYSGTFSARSDGTGTLSQDIDLENVTGLPVADIDTEKCFLTTRAFRRDTGAGSGQLRIDFLDKDGNVLGYGQSLSLGASGFVPNPLTLSGDFTLELWVKLDNPPTDDQIIFGGGYFGQGGGSTGTRLSFRGGTLRFEADNDDAYTGTTASSVLISSEAPVVGEWRHIAIVRDGSDMYLYENFRQTATNTGFVTDVWIDRWADGAGVSGFVGKWDELRVWNVPRTRQELGLNAHTPIDPASLGLIRYYHFNDSTGADLTGGDLTFSFAPGMINLQAGHGSPVSVPELYATDRGSASYNSGVSSVGGAWTEIEVTDHLIPANARRMRISFDAVNAGAHIDNLTGHIINTNEDGPVVGYMTNNIAWRCTTAGFANADQAGGGLGSTINVGPEFVGENAYLRSARVLSVTDNRTFVVEVDEPRAVDGWFNEGSAIFETGKNAGAAMEVKRWDSTTREVELFLSMPNQIKAGDYLSIYPGCDKSRISCAAIFGNIVNFFGTPDVPGQDELFRYPDSK